MPACRTVRAIVAQLDPAVAMPAHQGPAAFRDRYELLHRHRAEAPKALWLEHGFLPRLPESLEELDLLVVMHAKPRVVQRDGIRFEGLRYVSPTLAAFVREPVTIRHDPRGLSEVRVFHRDRFLCRAVSEEHAGATVTPKNIEAARRAHRRALRIGINERVARVAELLAGPADATQRCRSHAGGATLGLAGPQRRIQFQ